MAELQKAVVRPQQAKRWGVVIDPPLGENPIKWLEAHWKVIEEHCTKNGITYYHIVHDSDISEDGCDRRPHMHMVLCYLTRHTKQAVLREWQKVFGDGLLQVEKIGDLEASIRYLIHQDSEDKFHYSEEEVKTNNPSNYYRAIQGELNEITGSRLITLCEELNYNRLKILAFLGPNTYARLSRVIDMIIREQCDLL